MIPEVWTEEMKWFALHISYSTKLWFIHSFPSFFGPDQDPLFLRIRIQTGQKHADPKPWLLYNIYVHGKILSKFLNYFLKNFDLCYIINNKNNDFFTLNNPCSCDSVSISAFGRVVIILRLCQQLRLRRPSRLTSFRPWRPDARRSGQPTGFKSFN